MEDLKEVLLENDYDFVINCKKGALSRMTKPTNMNSMSSRSHSILTLTIETKQSIEEDFVIKTSKINFVDLAGS